GPGDIGAVAKLKETHSGDVLASKDNGISFPPIGFPGAVMAFAIEAKAKGDEEKVGSALRRLQEEDPTLDFHRDPQTGEQNVAGSMAFKKAAGDAQPTLLEPIMLVQVVVPEDVVGDVIGDLNGRRGRPLGMEPKGPMTEIKAEVPMAEMLNYAPDLRSITGGRGDYAMEFG